MGFKGVKIVEVCFRDVTGLYGPGQCVVHKSCQIMLQLLK